MSDTILVIDDEPNLLRMIEFTLQAEGYSVITAETGQEGLDKIRNEHPDLVILDVSLPDMTGIDICQELRNYHETIDLPIIMLSARSQTQDKIKGLRAGSDEYVTKPIDPEEIIARVEARLSRTRSLRESGATTDKQGKVFAFLGSKGGVGTTTIALNVALALATRETATALVELRPYLGTAALHFGMTPDRTLSSIAQLQPDLIDSQQLDIHLTNHDSGLRVLYAPQKVEDFQEISPEHTEAVIRGLSRMMDHTILDLPAFPTMTTRAALQSCHGLIIVIEPEMPSLVSAKAMLKLIQSWGNLPIHIVIMNRGLSGTSIAVAEIEDQLNCPILGVMTPAAELCAKSLKAGSPLLRAHPNSLATNSLLEITENLIKEYVMVTA